MVSHIVPYIYMCTLSNYPIFSLLFHKILLGFSQLLITYLGIKTHIHAWYFGPSWYHASSSFWCNHFFWSPLGKCLVYKEEGQEEQEGKEEKEEQIEQEQTLTPVAGLGLRKLPNTEEEFRDGLLFSPGGGSGNISEIRRRRIMRRVPSPAPWCYHCSLECPLTWTSSTEQNDCLTSSLPRSLRGRPHPPPGPVGRTTRCKLSPHIFHLYVTDQYGLVTALHLNDRI